MGRVQVKVVVALLFSGRYLASDSPNADDDDVKQNPQRVIVIKPKIQSRDDNQKNPKRPATVRRLE